ncbi:DivIVA domain-containing protein [Rothia uropygialis]|uniref:DivIVA domain-containing protein n=1 Tax=Kocuria sp. 36 TaxID=1415402 RepID=UPI00101D1207|nr:DivIVA domain-containing protein [Kocuria sp. 36]
MPGSSIPEQNDDSISATQELGRIGRVDPKKSGYSVRQVREILDRCGRDMELLRQGLAEGVITADEIRAVEFEPEKGGYEPADVDFALESYEDRFATVEKQISIQQNGHEAWHDYASQLADLVMGRLKRNDGERFRRPARRRIEGYFVGDVDSLCADLLEYFRHSDDLKPTLIRRASFRAATSKHAYDEAQVDAFLEKAIQLTQALR